MTGFDTGFNYQTRGSAVSCSEWSLQLWHSHASHDVHHATAREACVSKLPADLPTLAYGRGTAYLPVTPNRSATLVTTA